jgi:hypothetical protein
MSSRSRHLWWVALLSLAATGQIALTADPSSAATSGNDYAYVSPGHQYGTWSRADRRLRLGAYPQSTMSTNRCMDAMLDWQTASGHYDARVVRSCRPGGVATTDPGGDGYWSEPSDWAGRTVTDMQKGGGARIDDDYVNGNFALYAWEGFAGAGTGSYSSRPRTCTDKFARMRTLYQDGHFNACDSDPADPNG